MGKSDEVLLRQMLDSLRHRGPDGEGTYSIPGKLSMGMTRLAVIDLITGDQPIENEDKTIKVIHNGEIYNYKELRKDLKKRGHIFKTESDTEVIVHSYEEYGADCVTYFNGMFAFALWDLKANQLILARDRLGIKPLFYYYDSGILYFASEIKALLCIPQYKRELDTTALYNYLSALYIIGENSAFKGIKRFPQGHIAFFKNGKIRYQKYWDIRFHPKKIMSDREYIDELGYLFDDAVRLRLRADVPLGIFLSGGIDSAAIAESATRNGGRLKTFSMGFKGGNDEVINELRFAKETATFLETDHYEYIIDANDIACRFIDLIKIFDDLYCGPTPQFFLTGLAKRHVTVALTGLGGDELFGNYGRPERFNTAMGKNASIIKNILGNRICYSGVFRHIAKKTRNRPGITLKRCAFPGQVYSNRHETVFHLSQRLNLLSPDIKAELVDTQTSEEIYNRMFYQNAHLELPDSIMAIDLHTQLVDEYLAYVDRFTMSHALEARVPFLDHRLVEYCATLPTQLRDNKCLLRNLLQPRLPAQTFNRPKMGFALPYGEWLNGSLNDILKTYVNKEKIISQGIFNWKEVEQILTNFRNGFRGGTTYKLWSIVIFQAWHNEYIS
ncbi:MAG: asparagine synthase (glutamine-hydrolyzing) [Thermodesulfobacteriota bacterium]|nr:asparagine synthase (glutamine-hydrolyzing) [Thermodesulfobacteriota bacterium]